jgi:hypothetical protein
MYMFTVLIFLTDMRVDFFLGEHLLLIGNQGVGKNKLADKYVPIFSEEPVLFYSISLLFIVYHEIL